MSKKHGLMMMAGCLVAIGAAAAIFLFKVPTNSVSIVLLFLICPLSHLLMMGMMSKHDHESGVKPEGHLPDPASINVPKGLGEG
jgi:hypothetical protein